MATAQPGVFAQGTRFHHHCELSLRGGAGVDAVRAALDGLREPAVTAGGVNIVVGFGADLWRRLAPQDAPSALRAFDPVGDQAGRRFVATQRDLWVWVHGAGPDACFDAVRAATAAFAPVADLVAEQPCFAYRDSRDLTGFIDGTENPPVAEAPEVACVPPGEPGEGGSFAVVMRFVHDLGRFHALPVEDQERVIGRTKADSVQLDDDVRPDTAHISRVVVEDERGEELEIFRRSTPFGAVGEHGLLFVAFSADLGRFDRMLARMVGRDGPHDHLLDFTTPTSGAYYFVPSLPALAALGGG